MTQLSVGNTNTQTLIGIPPARFYGKLRQSLAGRTGLQKLADELNQTVLNSLTTIRTLGPMYASKSDCVRIEAGMSNVTGGLSILTQHCADAITVMLAGGMVGLVCQIGYQASHPFHLDSLGEWIIPFASAIGVAAVCGLVYRISGRVHYSLASFGLLRLIHDIAADESEWTSIDCRAAWTKRLDRIADHWIASKGQFAVPGKPLAAETDHMFRGIAEKLRSQQSLLVDSSEQSRHDLLSYLIRFLALAQSGEWHDLERTDVVVKPQSLSYIVKSSAKTVTLASLPPLAFVICHRLFPSLSIPIACQAIGEIAWPSFIVMRAVAPDLKELIELFKEIVEFFMGINSKKG